MTLCHILPERRGWVNMVNKQDTNGSHASGQTNTPRLYKQDTNGSPNTGQMIRPSVSKHDTNESTNPGQKEKKRT